MIVDLNQYKSRIQEVISLYADGTTPASISFITHMPLLAIYVIIAENFGYSDEIKVKIEKLQNYYDATIISIDKEPEV